MKKPWAISILIAVIITALMGLWLKYEYDATFAKSVETQENRSSKELSQEVVQEQEIAERLRLLGAKYDLSGLNLIWTTNPVKDCGWHLSGGCYSHHNKTIKMNRGVRSEVFNTVLAHEYLHYVWFSENLDSDSRLTSELIALYGRYPEFQQRIDGNHGHYKQSGTLQPTEFFSYGCTEISNAKLGAYISEKCKQYIDTDKLPALF